MTLATATQEWRAYQSEMHEDVTVADITLCLSIISSAYHITYINLCFK
jgi:hypothetical protein